MMTGCKCTVDNMGKFLASVKAMTATRCLVGIPAEKAPRKEDPINNAALGYIFEFGSTAANIPARPVLIPGVKAVQKETVADLKTGAFNAFKNPEAIKIAFNRVGLRAAAAVKKAVIALGDYPADSKTVAARKRKGFKGIAIERVTGSFINSFTYVIRGK